MSEVPSTADQPITISLRVRSFLATLIGVLACGILIGLPWLFAWCYPLGLLGYTVLIVRAARHSKLRAGVESFVIGAIALALAFHWAANSIFNTTHLSYTLSFLVYIGLVLWEAIAFMLLGLAASYVYSRGPRWLWLVVPVWVAIQAHWPKIFNWATAHAYLGFPPILQLAEWAGTSGVTACAVLASVALARVWLSGFTDRSAVIESTIAVLAVIAASLWGLQSLAHWQQRSQNSTTIRVAAIQVDPTFVESLGKMQGLSDHIRDRVDLLLWPESTLGHYNVTMDHFGDRDYTLVNSELPCPAIDPYPSIYCDLLAGGKTYDEGGRGKGPYKNTAFLLNKSNYIIGRYVKRTLMPIGEYVPGEKWFPILRDWAAVSTELIRGTNDEPLTLSSGEKIGVLVCYEDMVADNASSSVREGAQCLVALVNGSAFKDEDTLLQHLQLAQLRTIENRRAMIRCAATGVTCLIGPDGEIQEQLPLGVESSLVVDVPLETEQTFYTRHGEWFSRICSICSVACLLGIGIKRRESTKI